MDWIRVEQHPPGIEEWIIVGSCNYDVVTMAICKVDGEGFKFFTDEGAESELKFVTHWMPLPEPPNRNI